MKSQWDSDEFDFLDVPEGGVSLDDAPPEGDAADDPSVPVKLVNPMTGCIVDTGDIDSMIFACVDTKQQLADLRSFEDALRRKLGSLTTGAAKTRRVRGKLYVAKVEMPDDTWSQPVLKEAWNAYPTLRDEFLRISTLGVKLTEFKKMVGTTTDDPAFGQFQKMISAAKQPPTGAPTVSLEK